MGSNDKDYAPSGRPSVRLESKDLYNQVLIIVDFTHVPGRYSSHLLLRTVFADPGLPSGLRGCQIGLAEERSIS